MADQFVSHKAPARPLLDVPCHHGNYRSVNLDPRGYTHAGGLAGDVEARRGDLKAPEVWLRVAAEGVDEVAAGIGHRAAGPHRRPGPRRWNPNVPGNAVMPHRRTVVPPEGKDIPAGLGC